MMFLCAVPFLTFGLYIVVNALLFHRRIIRRPILLMGLTFPPFLVAQSVAITYLMRQAVGNSTADPFTEMLLVFGLPLVISVFLHVCYIQFYCLMEFSISLRMLEYLVTTENHGLTFHGLRTVYPLEEVIARKCEAAGRVGMLRIDKRGDGTYLALEPQGTNTLRIVAAIKEFCNWSDD